jgi:hypothetical protein
MIEINNFQKRRFLIERAGKKHSRKRSINENDRNRYFLCIEERARGYASPWLEY